MQQQAISKFNEHKTCLADIANEILNGKDILGTNGVKEIIALYLLIPYMTPSKLKTPNEIECIIPSLDGEFMPNINIKDLRDSLCHSFASVEENGNYIIIDDRALYSRKIHDKQTNGSMACKIPINIAHPRLLELVDQIRNIK